MKFYIIKWFEVGSMDLKMKENQPWIFNGRTDAEAEALVLWPPDGKNWLIGKDPDADKDWRQEKKGSTEDEMVGWHHWLNGHEFEQAPGVDDGQGSLACCSQWGRKELNTTELNWTHVHSYCPIRSMLQDLYELVDRLVMDNTWLLFLFRKSFRLFHLFAVIFFEEIILVLLPPLSPSFSLHFPPVFPFSPRPPAFKILSQGPPGVVHF